MLQRSPPGAHHRRPSQQQGKPSGNVDQMRSRRNTEASEVSPVLPNPDVYDPNELQQGRVDPFYGQTSGAGKSRTDLQRTLSSRNNSRRNVGGQGSRELSIRELIFTAAKTCGGHYLTRISADEDEEGRYWSEGRRENRGASRMFFITLHCSLADVDGGSVLNVGDGYNRGGPSRNPSRAYFRLVSLWRLIISWIATNSLGNPSRDHLGQFGQSSNFLLGLRSSGGQENDHQSTETNLHDRSGTDQTNVSNEMLSGQTSEKDPPGMSAQSPAGTEGVLEVLSDP